MQAFDFYYTLLFVVVVPLLPCSAQSDTIQATSITVQTLAVMLLTTNFPISVSESESDGNKMDLPKTCLSL